MKIRFSELRTIIKEAILKRDSELEEQAWVPGKWAPWEGTPPTEDDRDRLGNSGGFHDEYPVDEDAAMASGVDPHPTDLDEVDTDPANNPGRPADAFEYLGMHPKPTAAMSHPFAGGGGGETGSTAADPSKPPNAPGKPGGAPTEPTKDK